MKTMKDVLLEQGAAKGRTEGEEKGRQEGEALAILTVLESRVGRDAERLRERLFAIRDHGRLLELLVIATKVDSIEAFERALATN
jgi:flagellar biosynthesis/type III secretory pathway protein FliH